MTKPVHIILKSLLKTVFEVPYFVRNERKMEENHNSSFTKEECNEMEAFIEVSGLRHLKMVT